MTPADAGLLAQVLAVLVLTFVVENRVVAPRVSGKPSRAVLQSRGTAVAIVVLGFVALWATLYWAIFGLGPMDFFWSIVLFSVTGLVIGGLCGTIVYSVTSTARRGSD